MIYKVLIRGWWIATTVLYMLVQGQAAAAPLPSVYAPVILSSDSGAPLIRLFKTEPSSIRPGETSTLVWEVSGATTLSISPGVGQVAGTSIGVNPSGTTEYTLTAENAAGTATAKAVVTVTGVEPQSGATWMPFATNPDGSVVHTRGAALAVDPQGGIHVAYAIRTGLDNGVRPAYYAYCAADCALNSRWTRIGLALSQPVMDVRIALDPAGHPRLMIFSAPQNDSPENYYTYAVCNTQCTAAMNWTLTPLVTAQLVDTDRWNYAFRYFALDPSGHPAFFYTDSSQGINHNGTFYATCLKNPADLCSDAANWNETKVSPYWLGTPSLAFSSTGQPRATFFFFDKTNDDVIMRMLYLDCNADCLAATNWDGIFMGDIHGTARFSLRVNQQGQPRLLFYSGAYPDPAFEADRLYYLWCNTNCRSAGVHDWQLYKLDLPKYHGQNADLVLDPAGHPRIAYDAFGSGLSLAWCDSACESDAAVWEHEMLEKSSSLEADYPVAPIRRCSISTWLSGQQPMLAVDQAGHVRVSYGAQHSYGGTDLDEPWNTCPTFSDIILARFMQAALP